MFPPNSGSKCPKILKHVKQKWQVNAIKLGDRPTQYANTPSCDKYSSFGNRCIFHSMLQKYVCIYEIDETIFSFCRYFTEGVYDKLLKAKMIWDPKNIFNHCQSVGNEDQDCCPM